MTFHQKPNLYMRDISIKVSHLNRSLTFYEQFLGFKVLSRTAKRISFTVDGSTPILTIREIEHGVPREKRMTGLYHVALLLPQRTYLANFLNYLIQHNYPFGASDHIVSEALYFNDPDGNGIEIYVDRPATEWEWVHDGITMATKPLHAENLLEIMDNEWTTMPHDTVIGHVHLQVNDLEATTTFYNEGIGYDIVTRYPGACFLSTGKYHHHLAFNVWRGEQAIQPTAHHVGLDYFSIVINDKNEREAVMNWLNKLGYNV